MGKKWVTPSFKAILVSHCQDYLDSNDLGKDKQRTNLIWQVAGDIQESADDGQETVPPDLQKVSYRSSLQNMFRK